MSVVFGDGAGNFTPATVYPASTQPSSIAAGDFNGDGKPDLATANFGAASVTVRLNNGLGAFPESRTLPTGVQPLFVATGDLDGDGDVDLVTTNRESNTVSIFVSQNDGTFGTRSDFTLETGPRALIIEDLNGDGMRDIAAGTESSVIGVLLNSCPSNTAPEITTGVLTIQQDAGFMNSTIAAISDEQDAADALIVTIDGGTSATVNGVTLSNITVDAVGNVTAQVSASCGASDATFTLSATDSGGLSATGSVQVIVTNETTPPMINHGQVLPDITVYLPLNSPDRSRRVGFNMPSATDNCTAVPRLTSSRESDSVYPVGTTIVTVTATDEAGNRSSAIFRINVLFNFGGFLKPVEPFPMLNIATAGSAIPVKFSLSGDKGLDVLAAGSPSSGSIPCSEDEPGSTVEETNAGGSGLTYDSLSDQYVYVWKTSRDWKQTCRILIVTLADGSEHYAKFSFK